MITVMAITARIIIMLPVLASLMCKSVLTPLTK